MGKLLACLLIFVLLLPLIDLAGEKCMFANALKHDRLLQRRFLEKEHEGILQIDAGDAQYRLEDDPIEFRKYWVDVVLKCIVTPVIFINAVLHTIRIDLSFTLITIAVSLLKLVIPTLVRKMEALFKEKELEYKAQVRSCETEIAGKPCGLKMLGIHGAFVEKLDALFQNYFLTVQRKSIRYHAISQNAATLMDSLCLLAILCSGSVLASKGIITAGDIASMLTYLTVFDLVFGNTGSIIRDIPTLKKLYGRLRFLYEKSERTAGIVLAEIDSIAATDLSFSYNGKKVLQDTSFAIHRGEKIAITGENGCGKTTLMKILVQLLQSYEGELRINDTSAREFSLSSLRDKIAYACQDPYLFAGSVEENIALQDMNTSIAPAKALMEHLGITDLSGRSISAIQKELSGGEKQKISIARCLLKDHDLLLLDEPTNHLDAEAAAWLYQFIKGSDKTILFVTHDEKLKTAADRVLQL